MGLGDNRKWCSSGLPCAWCKGLRLAACGHPRPWTGVGTRFAFGTGRFLVGPAGLEDRQPSRSSSPLLGAWPFLSGALPPTYRRTKASSVDYSVRFPGSPKYGPQA